MNTTKQPDQPDQLDPETPASEAARNEAERIVENWSNVDDFVSSNEFKRLQNTIAAALLKPKLVAIAVESMHRAVTHGLRQELAAKDEEIERLNGEAEHSKLGMRQISSERDNLRYERDALRAEVERLKAGGCARDQRLTQFCAEAVLLQAGNETIKAEAQTLRAQLVEAVGLLSRCYDRLPDYHDTLQPDVQTYLNQPAIAGLKGGQDATC